MNNQCITDSYKLSPLVIDYRTLAYSLLFLFIAAPHTFPAPSELLKSQLYPFHQFADTGGKQ